MQCFVGTRKNHLNETLVFVYSKCTFFKIRGELLKARCEMSETRAHFELKEVEYLNRSLFVENQLPQRQRF